MIGVLSYVLCQIKVMEGDLTNLAHNIQGFTEPEIEQPTSQEDEEEDVTEGTCTLRQRHSRLHH